ncbi:MAG: MT-A70 family methyltransferase [bacterium]
MNINPEYKSLIPSLSPEEYAELESSILAEGCRDAIVTWNGFIVDGHNRYEICEKHGVPFTTVEKSFDNENEAKRWIIRNQFARRNLTPYQRSVLALKMEELIRPDAKGKQLSALKKGIESPVLSNLTKRETLDTRSEIARTAGVGSVTIHRVKVIEAKATPEQKEQLNRGETTINRVYTRIKREENREKNAELMKQMVAQPAGKYSTIIVDPPWPMKKIVREVRPNQAELDYPTMSVEEIKTFPIGDYALDDCHLYLWTTQKFLPAAFDVLKEWGFGYIFTMVWRKAGGFQPVGLPQYNCEFVLFGRRGNIEFLNTKDFFCAFEAPRREHSRKPAEFYDLIRRVSPGPRIDVFSREGHAGFDQWGNQTDRFGGVA